MGKLVFSLINQDILEINNLHGNLEYIKSIRIIISGDPIQSRWALSWGSDVWLHWSMAHCSVEEQNETCKNHGIGSSEAAFLPQPGVPPDLSESFRCASKMNNKCVGQFH